MPWKAKRQFFKRNRVIYNVKYDYWALNIGFSDIELIGDSEKAISVKE